MWAPSLSRAAAARPLNRLSVSQDERGLAIRATGHVDLTNPYMSGHFPSFQVYPGVFHLENVVYAVAAARADAGLGPLGIAEVRSMRFRAPLFAGDTFEVEATVIGTGEGIYDVDAYCRQANGAECARVKLVMQGVASFDA